MVQVARSGGPIRHNFDGTVQGSPRACLAGRQVAHTGGPCGSCRRRGRTERAHRALENAARFPRASTGRSTSDHPRQTPEEPRVLLGNPDRPKIGTDHDTGAFAVASIRGWWRAQGKRVYPNTKRLLITADGGGEQRLPSAPVEDGTAGIRRPDWLVVRVSHFPPGTSKWNKVAPLVFLHLLELARRTTARLRDNCPADCRDDHGQRTQCHVSTGPAPLCGRPQGLR